MKYSQIRQRQQEAITANYFLIYALIISAISHYLIFAIASHFFLTKILPSPEETPIELVILEPPNPTISKQQATINPTNQTPTPPPSPVVENPVENQINITNPTSPQKTLLQKTTNQPATTTPPPSTKTGIQRNNNQQPTPKKQPLPAKIAAKPNPNQQPSPTDSPENNSITPESTPEVPETPPTNENQSNPAINPENINTPTPSPESEPPTTEPPSDEVRCRECVIKYPQIALDKKIEGHTELIVDINQQGKITNYFLHKTSGSPELDIPSLEQIRNLQFQPLIVPKQQFKIRINYAISGTQYHQKLQERQRKNEQKRLQRIRENKPPENKIEIDVIIPKNS